MHPYHEELLGLLNKHITENGLPFEKNGFGYIGTTKPVVFIRAADFRKLIRTFASDHSEMSPADFTALLDSLSTGKTYIEFTSIGLLLEACPKLRAAIDPHCLEGWLEYAEGWAEVDVICQFNYTASEMLANWEIWSVLLHDFARSKNVHKRRASLVLLTKPLRQCDDAHLSQIAFENIDQLKGEKNILITKAVSWILRSLITYHRQEVERYLDENKDSLPKIAIRESRNKLAGGTKGKRMAQQRSSSSPGKSSTP